MGAMREKDEADFDLERFTEMFDTAMTSNDPRVKNALRQLMMMVILTDTGDHESGMRQKVGPLRRMQYDMQELQKWIKRLDDTHSQLQGQINVLMKMKSDPEWPRTSTDIWREQEMARSVSGEDYFKGRGLETVAGLSIHNAVQRKIFKKEIE